MSNFSCNCSDDCRFSCIALSVAVSLLLGIIGAFLQVTAAIALTPVIYTVAFGIAVLYLLVTLMVSAKVRESDTEGCVCRIIPILLAGILGTILVSALLITVAALTDGVLGIIFTGLLIGFFSLIITSTACLVKCLTRCDE